VRIRPRIDVDYDDRAIRELGRGGLEPVGQEDLRLRSGRGLDRFADLAEGALLDRVAA